MRSSILFFFSRRIAEAPFVKPVKEGQIGKANLLGCLNNGEFSASDQGFCLMKAYGVAIVYGGRSQIFLKQAAKRGLAHVAKRGKISDSALTGVIALNLTNGGKYLSV